MKITKKQLKQIIKEELQASLMQEREGETAQQVADRLATIPPDFRQGAIQDFQNMANGSTDMAQHYPHIKDLVAFAQEILSLIE